MRVLGIGFLSLFNIPLNFLHQTGRCLKEGISSPPTSALRDHIMFPYQTGISLTLATIVHQTETLQTWVCTLCSSNTPDSAIYPTVRPGIQGMSPSFQPYLSNTHIEHSGATPGSCLSATSYGVWCYVLCSSKLRW